ncbi:alpha/beta hydrolase [Nocardiopsis sp. NPDC006832]|uniref:alpha/beta fold hydrolase n=1 Tax=Nocardiopsis sp. NPDC006832 TaxID=3157188 RepID=UPI00340E1D2B
MGESTQKSSDPGSRPDDATLERFRHDGVEVAVRRAGDDGPGVVMLHNGGTSHGIWRHQIADLAADHRVVAIDLPGFGASPMPPEPIDLAAHVDLVAALVRHDGLSPVTLIGNCMGSAIAAGVAARDPKNVRALVMVNPLTDATFRRGGLGILMAPTEAWSPVTAPVRAALRRIRVPRAAVPLALRFQLGPAGVRAGLHHDPELTACMLRNDQTPALTDVLTDLPASYRIVRGPDGPPLCTIWGARNRVLSPVAGVRLDALLRSEHRVLVHDAGHMPMLERPETVTQEIRSFLDNVDSPAR